VYIWRYGSGTAIKGDGLTGVTARTNPPALQLTDKGAEGRDSGRLWRMDIEVQMHSAGTVIIALRWGR